MTLREKSRTALFTYFSDQLGEDLAEEYMAQYPVNDTDQLATKGDLAELRSDLGREIGQLRGEVKADLADVHQAIANQTKWLATMVFAALGVGLPVSVALTHALG